MNRTAAMVLSTGKRMMWSDSSGSGTLDRWLFMAAVAAFLATAASFFGRSFWLFELLTHFRLHLAAGAFLLLLWALARRRLVIGMLAAIAATANASPMIPYVMPGPVEAEAGASQLRLMAANVLTSNSDYAALREAIREEEPDLVGLMEVDPNWLEELKPATSQYPYSVLWPEEGTYGLALFSKVPVHELAMSPYIENGLQTAVAVELELAQVPVTLILTHVRAPSTPGRARLRNLQLKKLAEMLASDGNEQQILIGDLNTTPWSPYYVQLEAETQMTNVALGRGYQPTWPSGFGALKIPIDHCLMSSGLRVQAFRTGPEFGSDHLPIVVDIALAEAEVAAISAGEEAVQHP